MTNGLPVRVSGQGRYNQKMYHIKRSMEMFYFPCIRHFLSPA